jgi:hypothetical protein
MREASVKVVLKISLTISDKQSFTAIGIECSKCCNSLKYAPWKIVPLLDGE